jgi:hypothetical protein
MPCSRRLKYNISPETHYEFEACALLQRFRFSSQDVGR